MIMPSFCKRPFAVKWILLSDLGWFLSPNYMINHLFWLSSVSGNFLLHRMNLNVTKKHIQTTLKPFDTVWGDCIFPVWLDWNVDFILYCVIMIMPSFRATRYDLFLQAPICHKVDTFWASNIKLWKGLHVQSNKLTTFGFLKYHIACTKTLLRMTVVT